MGESTGEPSPNDASREVESSSDELERHFLSQSEHRQKSLLRRAIRNGDHDTFWVAVKNGHSPWKRHPEKSATSMWYITILGRSDYDVDIRNQALNFLAEAISSQRAKDIDGLSDDYFVDVLASTAHHFYNPEEMDDDPYLETIKTLEHPKLISHYERELTQRKTHYGPMKEVPGSRVFYNYGDQSMWGPLYTAELIDDGPDWEKVNGARMYLDAIPWYESDW